LSGGSAGGLRSSGGRVPKEPGARRTGVRTPEQSGRQAGGAGDPVGSGGRVPKEPGARRTGRVVTFDEHAGYGSVRAEDGTELSFHCTAIADGSRTIEVGTAVTFDVVSGHNGCWEAAALVVAPANRL
jgi:cold shock CspA family protein